MKGWDGSAAYGGPGYQARASTLTEELGTIWAACGLSNEWALLRAVLLHRPGPELNVADPNQALMLAPVDWRRAQRQHDALVQLYQDAGVQVHLVDPPTQPTPNQVFVADLMVMTPEGAIVGRPAGAARAGEERWVARRLADLGIPILAGIHGSGTFEGADLLWLNERTALIGCGLRTNPEGARQVAQTLGQLGGVGHIVDQPPGTMHLMGQLRFVGQTRAVAWPGRLPQPTRQILHDHGYQVLWMPSEVELTENMALNFVTLGPDRVVMPAGCPLSRRFLEKAGVACLELAVDELLKAAGGIGCMSAVLHRDHDS